MGHRHLASLTLLLLASVACSDDPPGADGAAGGAQAGTGGAAGQAGAGGKSSGPGGSSSAAGGAAGKGGAGGQPAAGQGGSGQGGAAGTGGAAGQGGASTGGAAGKGAAGTAGTAGTGGTAGTAGSAGTQGTAGASSGGAGSGGAGSGGAGSGGAGSGGAEQGGAGQSGSSGQAGSAGSAGSGVSSAPAWWKSAPVGGFVEIQGTNNCGVVANAYSGFTLKRDSAEIFFLAVGGHSDSSDNRVVSLGLLDDAPSWKLRNPPSTHPIKDAGYYDDGDGTPKKPGSTHTYDYTAWVPQAANGAGRLMRFGVHGTWPSGFDAYNIDGFDPVTNTWDPPGTYPDIPGNAGMVVDRDTGTVYAAGGSKRLALGGTQWEDAPLHTVRFPNAWDSKRHALFGMEWGDGQGYGDPVLTVVQNVPSTGVSTPIELADSEALAQLKADKPMYAGMDYDPILDKFLFYVAQDSTGQKTPNRIYVVTPNDTTTWTIDFYPLAPGSATPAAVCGAGVQGRFKYVEQLKGFVVMPEQSANLFFLRTAE